MFSSCSFSQFQLSAPITFSKNSLDLSTNIHTRHSNCIHPCFKNHFLSGDNFSSFNSSVKLSNPNFLNSKKLVIKLLNGERKGKNRPQNSSTISGSEMISKFNKPFINKRIFTEYKLSDFEISPHVSIGLSGRNNELIYEAVVKSPTDSLKGTRVVLRKLLSRNACKWGKRALEISSRISPRGSHPYTAQLHGYIKEEENDGNSLILVHGFYGNYSLHHWLHCPNWLPVLETQLALNVDGGPNVLRHLRVMKMVLRDVLIGVNYVHSRGMARLDLRLQNLHVCSADRHIKVGISGAAMDLSSIQNQNQNHNNNNNLSVRKNMTAFDIRCVGFMIVRILFKEFLCHNTYVLLVKFLKQGHSTQCLREFFRPIVCKQSQMDSIGMRVLDLNGGAGWHLLSQMLTNNVEERISCTDALKHPFLSGKKFRFQFCIPFSKWCIGSTIVKIVEGYVYLRYQRRRLANLINALEKMSALSPFQISEWSEHLEGNWRLIYSTGKQIGLTLRQADPAVHIDQVNQTFEISNDFTKPTASLQTEISFRAMAPGDWPAEKKGISGSLTIQSQNIQMRMGSRLRGWSPALDDIEGLGSGIYLEDLIASNIDETDLEETLESDTEEKRGSDEHALGFLPSLSLEHQDIAIGMKFDYRGSDAKFPERALTEVRRQIPHEMFDISKQLCVSYVDGRLLVVRSSKCTLVFVRSPKL